MERIKRKVPSKTGNIDGIFRSRDLETRKLIPNINTSTYWNKKYRQRKGGESRRDKRIMEVVDIVKELGIYGSALDFGCGCGHIASYLYALGCRPVLDLTFHQ